jgi:FMN-dependent NADH-azoreductase
MSTPHLFRLDASIQTSSVSRSVADSFERAWLAAHPDGVLTRRDLGAAPLPYLSESHLAAARGADTASSLTAALADELLGADAYLLAVPLYNWSIPASVKTWLDHLLVDERLRTQPPVLAGRPAVVVTSRGGAYGPGTPKEGWDYAEPYLLRVLGEHLGLDISVVRPELTLAGISPAMFHLQDAAAESLRQAHASAEQLAATLAARLAAVAA